MNIQPEPIADSETPPTTEAQPAPPAETETAPVAMQADNAEPDQEIMEESPTSASTPAQTEEQSFFFPDLLGDGRSTSVVAPDRDTAESRARQQLTQETAQSS